MPAARKFRAFCSGRGRGGSGGARGSGAAHLAAAMQAAGRATTRCGESPWPVLTRRCGKHVAVNRYRDDAPTSKTRGKSKC
eukprot:scaffold45576_cov67-Phaeocystis_antarctica.AAC.10